MKDTSKQSNNYRRVVKNIADEILKRQTEEFRSLLAKMEESQVEISLFPCNEPDKMHVDLRKDGFFYSKRIGSIAELIPFINEGIDRLQEAVEKRKTFRDRLESISNNELVPYARELGKKLNNTRFLQRFTRFLEKQGYDWNDYECNIDDLGRVYSFEQREEIYRRAISSRNELSIEDGLNPQDFYLLEEKASGVRIYQTSPQRTQKIRELALLYKDYTEKKK